MRKEFIQSTSLVIIYRMLLHPIIQLVNAFHDSCEFKRRKKNSFKNKGKHRNKVSGNITSGTFNPQDSSNEIL